jgi:hypothetical protein
VVRHERAPAQALGRRLAFVGTTGSGKTYSAKGGVERKLRTGERVVIIDPLDVWWGLRLAVDGKQPSPFEVVIFDGKHADMQISENGGKLLGEAVATAKESCIIPLGTLRTEAARRRFMVAFLDALYEHTDPEISDPYTIVFDEADLWAPQKPFGGHAEMLLHLVEEIVRRGRVRGFLPWLISQRPAIVNKNVLSQVDGMVAMQLTGAHDRGAIEAWIEGHGDKKETKELLASLARLQQGNGLLWVPRDGVLQTMHFPENVTFDSSRTPKRGEKKKAQKLKPLNLDKLKEKLATAEAETKANDPAALKKKVAELEAQLRKVKTPAPATKPAVDPGAIAAAEARGYKKGLGETAVAYGAFGKQLGLIAAAVERATTETKSRRTIVDEQFQKLGAPAVVRSTVEDPMCAPAPVAPPATRKPSPTANGDGTLTRPQGQLLQALAWWKGMGHDKPTRVQLAAMAGWKPKGSNLRNRLTELSTAGLIEYPAAGLVRLTDAGVTAAPPANMDRDLVSSIKAALTNPQLQIFDRLLESGSSPISREELASAVGWEASGSNLRNRLTELSAIEVIAYPGRGTVALQDWVVA